MRDGTGSFAVQKYSDGPWEGNEVQPSPRKQQRDWVKVASQIQAANNSDGPEPLRRYTDRGGTEVAALVPVTPRLSPHPPPPRSARFTYPLAVFAREAVVLACGSRPRRHREQHFSTAPCPKERKEREGEREEESGGGESRASQLTSD